MEKHLFRFLSKIHIRLLPVVIGLITSVPISAQGEPLPKDFAEAERELLSNFQFTKSKVVAPPSGDVRAAAEWEEIEYLVIRWSSNFQNILRQIVEAAIQECKVLIATESESQVQSYLTNNGISMANIEFLDAPTNSIWIRDYGGNTIYTDDVGERALVDWIYNRPRPDDDALPEQYADYLGLSFYETATAPADLVNTGGNFMSDGLGNAFASKLVLTENQSGNPYGVTAKFEADVDAIMSDYMGITNYIKMDVLPYDGIHHIDMHMKLLDEETLLVSRYPEGVADGPYIEDNVDYVTQNFLSAFGDAYKIEWIDAPPSSSGLYPDQGGHYRTYTNSVFINKTVIVPTYRPEADTDALALYKELLPGYNIVGIDVDDQGENLISWGGAIHCITHSIGVADPLWIVHQPLSEVNTAAGIPVSAVIKHDPGITAASVFWREAGDTPYQQSAMAYAGDDTWTVDLTVPSAADQIEYYIWAEGNSGKEMTRPIVAPDGYWTFELNSLSAEAWAVENIVGPYPNPATGEAHFNLNAIPGQVEVSVHDILGRTLHTETLDQTDGKITLQLHPQWHGTLFVSFTGEFGRITRKLLKLR